MLPFYAMSVPSLTLDRVQNSSKRFALSTVEPTAAEPNYNLMAYPPPDPPGLYNQGISTDFVLTSSYVALSDTKGRIQGESFEFTANQAVGAFQYLILYLHDAMAQASPILGYWKFPTPISLAVGERIRFSFNNKQLGEICDITVS